MGYLLEDLPRVQQPAYFIGLDLGQSQDFSAMAILERHGASKHDYAFHCRHLHRWKLRTSYPAIVAESVAIANDPKLRTRDRKPLLAVDATGVGAPVIDLFKKATLHAKLEPVQIVGGSTVSKERGLNRVPKRDLVSVVQVALQNGRLRIAEKLPDAATLVKELQNFQVKITDTGNDTYGAWREGTHDDLVLAVALALWCAVSLEPAQFYSW